MVQKPMKDQGLRCPASRLLDHGLRGTMKHMFRSGGQFGAGHPIFTQACLILILIDPLKGWKAEDLILFSVKLKLYSGIVYRPFFYLSQLISLLPWLLFLNIILGVLFVTYLIFILTILREKLHLTFNKFASISVLIYLHYVIQRN